MTSQLLDAISRDPAYRLTESDFEELGAMLLGLPLGDPLRTFWSNQRHLWLRNRDTDTERVLAANTNLLEELGLMQIEEIDLDW